MDKVENDRTIGRTNVTRGGGPGQRRVVTTTANAVGGSGSAVEVPLAGGADIVHGTAGTHVRGSGGGFDWPTSSEHYKLINRIGQGAFASVWRARCVFGGAHRDNELEKDDDEGMQCAIKIMDLEHVNINISDIRLEVQTMRLSSHPNVLVCHTSFIRDTDLWLVTQLMSKGSSLHCLQSARAKILIDAAAKSGEELENDPTSSFMYSSDDALLEGGLTAYSSLVPPESLLFENHITYILYETLLGLKYIHDNGQIHRDIKAGNLLLDGEAHVRIADFGVSSWLIDSGNRREHTTTFVGTPCWMAPEVMEQVDGYDYKADIWSLGITALELAKGYAPYAKYAPMKVLLLTIQEDPPCLDTYNDGDDANMWSKSFRSMVNLCLQKDPNKRPTCHELLAHRHFKPLSTDDGREEWRLRTKAQLCGVVDDVGKSNGESRSTGNMPGNAPIQVISSLEKDRPAGTSWILPGGSQVQASSAKAGEFDDELDFFDQFEQQTGGENFVRSSGDNSHPHNNTCSTEKAVDDNDKDDMNDFFDEFEKATGGENFRRAA